MWGWRRRTDEDFSEEIRANIALDMDRFLAEGIGPEEARAAALRAFGNVTRTQERFYESRRVMWMDDLLRDVRYALRTLSRAPGFTAVAVLTLALGIGVNAALFSVVRQVLLKTLPVANPQELVEIDCSSSPAATGGSASCMHSYPAFRLLSERHAGLSGVSAFSPVPNGLIASYEGRREVITGQLASANIFDVLGVAPAAGRLLLDIDDSPGAPPVAALGYGYWLRSFAGNPDVVGRSLVLNGRAVTIAGVLPRSYRGVTFGEPYDVVLPLGKADRGVKRPTQRVMYLPFGQREIRTVTFTVRAETAVSSVSETVRRTLERLDPGVGIEKTRTANAQFDEVLRRERLLAVLAGVFGGLALLLLAVGLCGMLNAMVVRRTIEIGIRMALGAARHRIAWMLARETLVVLMVGIGLGIAGHLAAAQLIRTQLFGVEPSDPTAVGAAVTGLVLIAAMAVWLPARRATKVDPMVALRCE